MSTAAALKQRTLQVVREQLKKAIGAKKCHPCGCLHDTVAALAATDVGRAEFAALLGEAAGVVKSKQYDCLGCAVCYPAVAANALAEAFPEAAERLAACPTESPRERSGWPPLPGDYHVVRYAAPVAVCTLNSDELARRLATRQPSGLGIVGTLHTENLGIERVIRNILANPHLRFLVVCGEDTRQAVGHLPGQSLANLFINGIDDQGRIRGALGKRPILKNVTADQVGGFVRQVELVALIGERHEEAILRAIEASEARDPGVFTDPIAQSPVTTILAREPDRLIADPAGFFVVYPDSPRQRLVVEHYTPGGLLDCIIEGRAPSAIYAEAIDRGLLTRLDHAAYLGRELAIADRSLRTGERYVQDRAPGEPAPGEPVACGCGVDNHAACEHPMTEDAPRTVSSAVPPKA